MVGPKKQDFCPRINMLKGKKIKKFCRWMTVHRKVPKRTLKFDLLCQKSSEFFHLGNHFLLKTLFSSFNFWTTLFSKIMPNFWRTVSHCFEKISFEHVDSWAKILLFRTHHLWNSTTELILRYIFNFHRTSRHSKLFMHTRLRVRMIECAA